MTQLNTILATMVAAGIGAFLGYFARQSIAKRDYATIESKIQKRIEKYKKEAKDITSQAKEKSAKIIDSARREVDSRNRELLKREKILLKRENILDEKISVFEKSKTEFGEKVQRLKRIKENLENLEREAQARIEEISGLSEKEAKEELFKNLQKEYNKEILEKIKKLETEGYEKFEQKAKEILAATIQKLAVSQAQEITTTTLALPSEDIKGRIIGKDGRNIRTLEKLTGVEIIIDETPELLVISGFDPIRRHIAKIALEKLMEDGRIQPARIEEQVKKVESEIQNQIKKAGEQAAYEVGVLDLDPKLMRLLGRLKFRTSYGQNVLLHSIEVALLARALAYEIEADPKIALKAGLLHDIGKSVDHQIEGSHVDIGIKILEKFEVEKEVITAMKSHHEEYPYGSLESILVQTADAISSSRPGARKDTLENYLKRLGELEEIALSFPGVTKAWALHAGREIRVFVKPEEIDDLSAKKLAKEIANKIQTELRYPGEIKVTLIRERRIVEYAR
ncbi:ribonuclease [Parcubacteria bacterium DG_74_3]|nr:MAG: ribonuclease [Parcubacteria bacterium DG_74_3]